MNQPRISIVIPAYNASSTINRCLNSLYKLPLAESDFEVIVVDDCSQDNTAELVEAYAKRHSNLALLRQPENHSLGAARNRGVSIAQGKYIVFVDSDDESAEGMPFAVQLAEENDLDMVAMRFVRIAQDGSTEKEISLPYDKSNVYTGVEMQTEFPYWAASVWPYVYKRSFLEEVEYPFAEDVFYEDSDFTNVHLFHAKRMSYCDVCGYVVHSNPASITHTLSFKHLSDYALMGTRMLRFFENLEDMTSLYAQGIREGGQYNITKSFHRLPKLKSRSAVRSFYKRLDAHFDRKQLIGRHELEYHWDLWTRLGLKHQSLCVFLLGCIFPIVKLFKK